MSKGTSLLLFLDQAVDKGVGPEKYRDQDGCDNGGEEQIHGAAVVCDGKHKCGEIECHQENDADDGENLLDFFHIYPPHGVWCFFEYVFLLHHTVWEWENQGNLIHENGEWRNLNLHSLISCVILVVVFGTIQK